jgi:hypothetical protein
MVFHSIGESLRSSPVPPHVGHSISIISGGVGPGRLSNGRGAFPVPPQSGHGIVLGLSFIHFPCRSSWLREKVVTVAYFGPCCHSIIMTVAEYGSTKPPVRATQIAARHRHVKSSRCRGGIVSPHSPTGTKLGEDALRLEMAHKTPAGVGNTTANGKRLIGRNSQRNSANGGKRRTREVSVSVRFKAQSKGLGTKPISAGRLHSAAGGWRAGVYRS